MKIEQIYTGYLAHWLTIWKIMGRLQFLTPLREVQPFVDRAKKELNHN